MNPPNKNPTTEGCYYLPIFLMLNQMLSLFTSTTLSLLRHAANIGKSIKRILWSHQRKKQAYAKCFCPHQLHDITGTLNLRVTITF